MERKNKHLLPSLASQKPKTRLTRDKLKIEDIFITNASKLKPVDYRSDEQFSLIKASNFLSRVQTIDSPQIIFNISEQIKDLVREDNEKQNNNHSSISNSNEDISSNHNISKKSTYYRSSERTSAGDKKIFIAQQRHQALNLARWMDEKLSVFKSKKTITFLDILEYKQTILNFALGKIIDSLTKKCKEEGQILSLIWNNTFTMFEGVFHLLIQANTSKEKKNNIQSKELHQIFQVNHNFLREEKQVLTKQNNEIMEKMRNVILWNKRLRRQRKRFSTSNRILQYRNATYSQALQQTLQMLLQSSPEPTIIQFAKKIITRLTKEKGKRKQNYKKQIDSQLQCTTRQIVHSWLKKNIYLDQQRLQLFKQTCFIKEDGFMFSEFDDQNEMKKVDIYDFFKLFDVGVQAVCQMTSQHAQCDKKIIKNVETMTKNLSTIQHGCQTMANKRDSLVSLEALSSKMVQNLTKQSNRSTYFNKEKGKIQQSNPSKKDKQQNVGNKSNFNTFNNKNSIIYPKDVEREAATTSQQSRRDAKKWPHNADFKDKNNVSKYGVQSNLRDDTSQNESFNTYSKNAVFKINQEKDESEKADDTSISDLFGQQARRTSQNMITNYSPYRRDKSINDFTVAASNKQFQYNSIGVRRGNQKRSMAYIKGEIQQKSLSKLVNKQFSEAYKEQRQLMDKNKEEFVDQLIRSRSFYTKRRVQFANFKDAEEISENNRQFLRGARYNSAFRHNHTEHTNYMSFNVERLTKKVTAPSNIAKCKALMNSRNVFQSITSTIENIVRIPPKNKAFVNNSLASLTKYISDLVFDYLRQIKKQKQQIPLDCQKALYPLSVLLMERMTCKYGLKDIAEKKIKDFIEKILTFASISQKIELYSLLLGLEDENVGSDELLLYLKCLVYFDANKPSRDSSIQSTVVDIQLVRQNLRKILQYFFDKQYINLIELKLQIYFQQNSPYVTAQGISTLIIRQLLKRKKDLKMKYSKIHQLCTHGDNFFTNLYKLMKLVNCYRIIILNSAHDEKKSVRNSLQSVDALSEIKNRAYKKSTRQDKKVLLQGYGILKISVVIKDILKRSDIVDQEHGKSITQQRFITAAMLHGLPTTHDLEIIFSFFQEQFNQIQQKNPYFKGMDCHEFKTLDKLARAWNKGEATKSDSRIGSMWTFAKVYSEKVENVVFDVLGKIGLIGLQIENCLFTCSS